MPLPTVAVVLINWKRPEEVAGTVAAIAAQDYAGARVTIVNNGDPAALRAALGDAPPIRVDILEPGRNTGFAGACNLALGQASRDGVDYLWILNTDTRLPPGCLPALMADAEAHPEAGLFSPVLLSEGGDNPVWIAGGWFEPEPLVYSWIGTREDAQKLLAERPHRLMLPGTALLVRRTAYERIGPMDEAIFAYHEDVDFSIRAAQAGIGRRLVTDLSVFHGEWPIGPLRPHVAYYIGRNGVRMARKHAGLAALPRCLLWEFLRLRRCCVRHAAEPEVVEGYRRGFWHGMLGISGEIRERPATPALLRWLTPAEPAARS